MWLEGKGKFHLVWVKECGKKKKKNVVLCVGARRDSSFNRVVKTAFLNMVLASAPEGSHQGWGGMRSCPWDHVSAHVLARGLEQPSHRYLRTGQGWPWHFCTAACSGKRVIPP